MMLIFDRLIEAISRAVTSCHSLGWITSPKRLTGMQLNTDARRCGLEPLLQFLGRDINTGYTRFKEADSNWCRELFDVSELSLATSTSG